MTSNRSDRWVAPAALLAALVAAQVATQIPFRGQALAQDPPAAVGMPVGAVIAWAGATIPEGWLLCDGRSLSAVELPELAAALGSTYGASEPGTFYLPDYRGMFLRGADHGAAQDPDRDGRTPQRAGAAEGDRVGSVQEDAVGRHEHEIFDDEHWVQIGVQRQLLGNQVMVLKVSNYMGLGVRPAPSASTSGAGQTESRPRNVAVDFIIKAR